MNISIGKTLAELRQAKNLTQKALAERLTGRGYKVGAKTIYNWEKDLAQPNIQQFLTLCDILDADDIQWRFLGLHRGPYAGLNTAGRAKARELISLLFQIGMYRDDPAPQSGSPRLIRLYDVPVSAGTGNFLEDSGYGMIETPDYVDKSADFALRVSGDSMEPLLRDSQIIWVKEQETLKSGEIGVFYYYDGVYCKKLVSGRDGTILRSLNPAYDDIEVNEKLGFKVVGKVVS